MTYPLGLIRRVFAGGIGHSCMTIILREDLYHVPRLILLSTAFQKPGATPYNCLTNL
jgi:hypothetical protein